MEHVFRMDQTRVAREILKVSQVDRIKMRRTRLRRLEGGKNDLRELKLKRWRQQANY
jgi:hypothetical protein